MPRRPIGIFDSGVGGLTVLKAVHELMPGEDLLYLGDTARVPYGTKSAATIARYALEVASRLVADNVKMLVIACNTATAAALPALRERFAPLPVIGVIEPGARAAVAASPGGHIAVIGTEATIRGGAYQKAIGRLAPKARVVGRACTLFVPLAEEGWTSGSIAEGMARRYLDDIFGPEATDKPDTLLLGCTHFPLLRDTLATVAGERTRIVDSAAATAIAVRDALGGLELARAPRETGKLRFLTTDNPERFSRAGGFFLRRPIRPEDVELIDL